MPYPKTTSADLIVALDMGKNVHWLGCYDGLLHVIEAPHKVRSDLSGFDEATSMIDHLLASGQFRESILGHECTGVYHQPWAWRLCEHYQQQPTPCPVDYRWLNPLLTRRRQEHGTLRPRLVDRDAVAAIASCLADGLGQPAAAKDAAVVQLGEAVQSHDEFCRRQRHLARILLPQIDRLWPGTIVDVKRFRAAHPEMKAPTPLVQTRPLDRERLAVLMVNCPNPYDALALGEAGLARMWREQTGRSGDKAVGRILDLLQRSLLPPPEVAAVYAHRLQTDFKAYVDLRAQIASGEAEIAALVAQTDARYLDSVPGISPLLAARYLTAIGAATLFPTAAQIWAFAGLDPIGKESGDSKKAGHISRRGDPHFRRALFQIGFHAAQQCAAIGQSYLAARMRGMDEVAATIHAAHKANRLCFTLLRERRFYRSASAEEEEAFRERWQEFHNQDRRRRHSRRIAS